MQTSHFSAMVKTHTGASSCPQTEQPVKKSNIMFETHVCVCFGVIVVGLSRRGSCGRSTFLYV